MALPVLTKRFSRLAVSIRQKERNGSSLLKDKYPAEEKTIVPFYERRLLGLKGGSLKQRTLFFPKRNCLIIELTQKGKLVGHLRADINKYSGESEAVINWKEVDPKLQKSGLATQMLVEAMSVMKKAGVKKVSSQVVNGLSIYRMLGFSETHRFG